MLSLRSLLGDKMVTLWIGSLATQPIDSLICETGRESVNGTNPQISNRFNHDHEKQLCHNIRVSPSLTDAPLPWPASLPYVGRWRRKERPLGVTYRRNERKKSLRSGRTTAVGRKETGGRREIAQGTPAGSPLRRIRFHFLLRCKSVFVSSA